MEAVGQEHKGHVYIAQTSGVLQNSELASDLLVYGTVVQFHIVILSWAPEAPQIAS